MNSGILQGSCFSLIVHALLMFPWMGQTTSSWRADVVRGRSSVELVLAQAPQANQRQQVQSQGEAQAFSEQAKPQPASRWLDEGALTQAAPLPARNTPPRYPKFARLNGWAGTVVVRASVSASGKPLELRVQKSSGYAILDRAALGSVRRWQFLPGRREGEAVASIVEIPISFELDD